MCNLWKQIKNLQSLMDCWRCYVSFVNTYDHLIFFYQFCNKTFFLSYFSIFKSTLPLFLLDFSFFLWFFCVCVIYENKSNITFMLLDWSLEMLCFICFYISDHFYQFHNIWFFFSYFNVLFLLDFFFDFFGLFFALIYEKNFITILRKDFILLYGLWKFMCNLWKQIELNILSLIDR